MRKFCSKCGKQQEFYVWRGNVTTPCIECKKATRKIREKKKAEKARLFTDEQVGELRRKEVERIGEHRRCSICGETKHIDNFGFLKKYGNFSAYCKSCRVNKQAEVYRKRKSEITDEMIEARKAELSKIKNKQCARCKKKKSISKFRFLKDRLAFNSYCFECNKIIKSESEKRARKRNGVKLTSELKKEVTTKICTKCKKKLSANKFCWNYKKKEYDNTCRKCKRNEEKRVYRKTEKGKAKTKSYNRSSKARASRLIYKAKNGNTILDSRLLQWAQEVYKKENYKCQRCGKNGKLNAHHILSKAKVPDLKYDINNGICLCEECHIQLHAACGKITDAQDLFEFMNWEWSR